MYWFGFWVRLDLFGRGLASCCFAVLGFLCFDYLLWCLLKYFPLFVITLIYYRCAIGWFFVFVCFVCNV